jgi:hypothetical protein
MGSHRCCALLHDCDGVQGHHSWCATAAAGWATTISLYQRWTVAGSKGQHVVDEHVGFS